MAKINMTTLNIELTPWNQTKSNKNLTSDLLNDIASIMGFDTKYLCEEYNPAIGYAFEEDDVPIIKEMLDIAKTKEGRAARCRKYNVETYDVIKYWFDSFCVLAVHNGVDANTLTLLKVKMHEHTDFIILRRIAIYIHPDLEEDMNMYYFAPTDYLVDEEDKLEACDIIYFLEFLISTEELPAQEISAIYWCFVSCKESYVFRREIDGLKASISNLNEDSKKELIEAVRRRIDFEKALYDNEEYVQLIQQWARIEGGECRLQDKKRVKKIVNRLVEVMDDEAVGIMPESEYSKGVVRRKAPLDNLVDIDACFKESNSILEEAFLLYKELKARRSYEKVNDDNRTILEISFAARFKREMF